MTDLPNKIDKETMENAISQMLSIVANVSKGMPKFVFQAFIDQKAPPEEKQIYNLFADSFLSLRSFGILMFDHDWAQASTILRMAIEQVAAAFVLAYNPSLRKAFLDLQKEKYIFFSLTSEQEKKDFAKKRGIEKNQIYAYLDYSWIKTASKGHKFKREDLLELAKLGEFNEDIEQTLNSFSHGSLSIFQFYSKDEGWGLMERHARRILLIGCKLFDFLVCSWCAFSGKKAFPSRFRKPFEDFKKILVEAIHKITY